MHSLNGDWQECSAEEHSLHSSIALPLSSAESRFQNGSKDFIIPKEGSSSECSSDPNKEGFFEALNLICQSSPILDTREWRSYFLFYLILFTYLFIFLLMIIFLSYTTYCFFILSVLFYFFFFYLFSSFFFLPSIFISFFPFTISFSWEIS